MEKGSKFLREVAICQNGLDDMHIFWMTCSSSNQVSGRACEANSLFLLPGSLSDKCAQKVKCKRNVPTEFLKEKRVEEMSFGEWTV